MFPKKLEFQLITVFRNVVCSIWFCSVLHSVLHMVLHSSLFFIPFCFNLYISLLYHTLSKALDMSRKNIHLTSYSSMSLSKEVKISWVIDSSSFIEASPALKPGSFGEIRLLSKKYFNMLSYMIRSKIMLQIWRR